MLSSRCAAMGRAGQLSMGLARVCPVAQSACFSVRSANTLPQLQPRPQESIETKAQIQEFLGLPETTADRDKREKFLDSRLSDHGIPGLYPWTPWDLTWREQLCYMKFGPRFAQNPQIPEPLRDFIKKEQRDRTIRAAQYERKLGDDWYSIYTAAKELKRSTGDFHPPGPEVRGWYMRLAELNRKGASLVGQTAQDQEYRELKKKCKEDYVRRYREHNAHHGNLKFFIERVVAERRAGKNLPLESTPAKTDHHAAASLHATRPKARISSRYGGYYRPQLPRRQGPADIPQSPRKHETQHEHSKPQGAPPTTARETIKTFFQRIFGA